MVRVLGDGRHGENGSDVVERPLGHDVVLELFDSQALPDLLHILMSVLLAVVVPWLLLVIVIVGLHKVPGICVQLFHFMNAFAVSFNHCPLVRFRPTDHVVDGRRNLVIFQSFQRIFVGVFLFQDFSNKVRGRDILFNEGARDNVVYSLVVLPGILVDHELAWFLARGRENAADNHLHGVLELVSAVHIHVSLEP